MTAPLRMSATGSTQKRRSADEDVNVLASIAYIRHTLTNAHVLTPPHHTEALRTNDGGDVYTRSRARIRMHVLSHAYSSNFALAQ